MLFKRSHTYVIFWSWIFLLIVIPLRSVQVVCINSTFLFIAKWYSMIWMYHNCDIDPSKDIWVITLWGYEQIVQFSHSVVSDFLWPHGLQHTRTLSITNSWSLLKLRSIESVMPSNHLILCHPLLLSPSIFSQHQGLFKWVSSSYQVAKILEFQFQHQSFQWTFRTDFLEDGLVASPCSPRHSQESFPIPQFKSINSLALSFLYSPTLTSIHDYWKNHSFDKTDLCWQSNVSAF